MLPWELEKKNPGRAGALGFMRSDQKVTFLYRRNILSEVDTFARAIVEIRFNDLVSFIFRFDPLVKDLIEPLVKLRLTFEHGTHAIL